MKKLIQKLIKKLEWITIIANNEENNCNNGHINRNYWLLLGRNNSLFACLTAALQAYSKRNVNMKQTEKVVSIENKLHFQQDNLALDDGSTAPVPLRPRLRPWRPQLGPGLASHDSPSPHWDRPWVVICASSSWQRRDSEIALDLKVGLFDSGSLSAVDTDEASDVNCPGPGQGPGLQVPLSAGFKRGQPAWVTAFQNTGNSECQWLGPGPTGCGH